MTNVVSAMDNMFSISDFNKGKANKIFSVIRKRKVGIVVKNNKPECVMISPEEYRNIVQRLKEADDMERELRTLKGLPEKEPEQPQENFFSINED